jgi:dethiobiotin synthetase
LKPIYFITGTDTGVGKTVLTALLARFLRERGVNAAALKPICSGGRDDALSLLAALGGSRSLRSATVRTATMRSAINSRRQRRGALSLDEINPWYFRTPLAPLLAARREKKHVRLPAVAAHCRRMQERFEILLVEGAGGLLSPLGEGFNSRDLILALGAMPVIVAPNRLGALNHIRLTLESLPPVVAATARVVLMLPEKPDLATATNAGLLARFFDIRRIYFMPWLGRSFSAVNALKNPRVRWTLRALL